MLLTAFGFEMKQINGSHHIFKHPNVSDLLSIQPDGDSGAKPYQIRQFLKIVEANNLKLKDEDEA